MPDTVRIPELKDCHLSVPCAVCGSSVPFMGNPPCFAMCPDCREALREMVELHKGGK